MAKLLSYASDTWLGLLFTIKRESVTFLQSTLRFSRALAQCRRKEFGRKKFCELGHSFQLT